MQETSKFVGLKIGHLRHEKCTIQTERGPGNLDIKGEHSSASSQTTNHANEPRAATEPKVASTTKSANLTAHKMKTFISLIAFLSMLSLSIGLAPNYISRSPSPAPAPVPGFLDGVLDGLSDGFHALSKAGKLVLDQLDKAEQELLERDDQLVVDGCNIVRCGVELGFTSVKCLIDVVGTKGIGQVGKKEKLGCLAEVSHP